jgi:DNA repair protein SbcC/Rad50
MIPLRISLKGFLCYKDEQEISFDSNATLWMLSGLNGSGKSSIFDGVTYALFGHHRGGSQHAVELINKDSDGLSVEFEFRLDNHVYRVRRTLRRTARGSPSSTQQIYSYEADGKKNWAAVEGSNYKRQFEDWISERIGLTYETFTSSVLLLQGKAEKLLGSKPEDRRAVLASIVDLERYERLHEKADAKRKELKGKLEGLSDRLAALPEVKPEQVAEVEGAIRIADEARQQANEEVERLHELERQAKNWKELQGKLAAARQRWERAEQLLEKSADIERDLERLRQLREVLPHLREIIKQRGTIRAAELAAENLKQEKKKAAEKLALCESTLKQARDKRDLLQKCIEEDEKKQSDVAPKLRVVAEQKVKLDEYGQQSAELVGIRNELSLLPGDAAEQANRAKVEHERLAVLNQLLSPLVHFQEHRQGLRQALEGEQTAKQRLIHVEARGKELKAELERLGPLVQSADRTTRLAKDQETEARTLLKQARDSLREITELDGSKRCRHCGQELKPGHLEDEKQRRDKDVLLAEERLREVAAALQAAQREEKQWREQEGGVQKDYQEMREEYREVHSQAQQARNDVTRLQSQCARACDELPEEHRQRISRSPAPDWTKTEYPTAENLEQVRAEAAGHSVARQRWHKAEEVLKLWNKLKTQESGKLATLERLQSSLPPDREAVRQTYTDLSVQLDALDKELKAKRGQLKEADKDIDRLSRERDQAKDHVKNLDAQLKDTGRDRLYAEQAIAVNHKALPAAWQTAAETAGAAEYNQWDKERADLETSGVEQRGQELQQACIKRDEYRQNVENLEVQQKEFAAEVRRNPEHIKAEMEQAVQRKAQRDDDMIQARQRLARLEDHCKQREQIGAEMIRLERDYSHYKTLADLLGKDRLQLYLVRQAEKQVVEHANSVLDRLSGGQLYLKLRGEAEGEGSSGKALELESYNRVTGDRPINVAFLSGSQKFRVAVSLALGIGQYASRQHRPIESVIIDEGFGCLDSQGRQVMIQELQNLRSQMRCILLVSHQEDFAEAFSDGYHFELEAGATRIKRFQK